jgi:hypothetical protein
MVRTHALAGVALGFRPELAGDLLRAPESVDFLEVVADTCFAQPAAWREACALAELTSIVPHGVKLSLGSAAGIELPRARKLGALARDLRAPAISEHVAFTRAGGREIGHLTPVPFTREAVGVVARNVAAARRLLPDVPLLLENPAWTFRWPEDEMTEGDFYAEVMAATGAPLLLDLANLYANAQNSGVAPDALLRAHPLDRVGMVHVAGGVLEDGFFLDTHAHPVPEAVFSLLATLLASTGPLPIVLERDQDFSSFAQLRLEVERLRELVACAPARRRLASPPPAETLPATPDASGLGERQAAVARMLTGLTPTSITAFDAKAIARTRAVLQHKRVDEALPLVPRLAAAGEPARRLALRVVEATPRAPRGTGIADALHIADAAADEPALAAAARRDRLELRSRFARQRGTGACGPRRGPFLGREALPGGGSAWALKGLGSEAPVRLIERGGRR